MIYINFQKKTKYQIKIINIINLLVNYYIYLYNFNLFDKTLFYNTLVDYLFNQYYKKI